MYRLDNSTRRYSWGSRHVLAELLGRPVPSPEPEAELWLGAHSGAPSRLVGEDGSRVSLRTAIEQRPAELLGTACLEAFGPELPFLLKVLAVEDPLSLQVHPDRARAAAGYAAEQAAALDVDDPQRMYRDTNHKPELICALTPFDALCGFRPVPEILAILDELAIPALKPAAERLARSGAAPALRALLVAILDGPDPEAGVNCARDAVREHREDSSWADSYDLLLDLTERFPGDPGTVVSLLLNHVRLRPGDAMYLPPGRLHAYLHGVGVEVMACSDNVLRGGLTSKHVDVAELLAAAELRAGPAAVITPHTDRSGWGRYPVPIADFELARIRLTGDAAPSEHVGPQILICLDGSVGVRRGECQLTLARGESVYVPAGAALTVRGHGDLARATTGPLPA